MLLSAGVEEEDLNRETEKLRQICSEHRLSFARVLAGKIAEFDMAHARELLGSGERRWGSCPGRSRLGPFLCSRFVLGVRGGYYFNEAAPCRLYEQIRTEKLPKLLPRVPTNLS